MRSPTLAPVEIDYPTEDGVPMAENDAQAIALMYAVTGLRDHFRHRPDVYVSGNLLIYYEEGNVNASVAPDTFVVFGVPNHIRPIYKVWEEGKAPDFVLEIASPSTWNRDQGPKRELYESLGVREYWQYDPTGDYLAPPLRGLQLLGGAYVPMAQTQGADGAPAMYSAVLELDVCIVHGELRFHDPVTGQNILTLTESNEEREREKQARQEAEQRRQRAEQTSQQADQARQQAEQARQRAEQTSRQAAQARQQAEQARLQAEQQRHTAEVRLEREVAARQAAAARVAELEALLERRQGDEEDDLRA